MDIWWPLSGPNGQHLEEARSGRKRRRSLRFSSWPIQRAKKTQRRFSVHQLQHRGDTGRLSPSPSHAAQMEQRARTLPGLFVALDREGRVAVWSEECERLTGWTAAEVRRDPGCLFPDPDDCARVLAEWKSRSRMALYYDWEWHVTCRDRSRRTFSWTSCSIFMTRCWSKWALGRDVTHEKKSKELLKEVAQGFNATSADDFFQQLVRHLTSASGMELGLVGEIHPKCADTIRTLAIFMDGQPVPNFEYNLDGSPCEGVVKQAARTLRSGVQAMFPEDDVLKDLGVESYVGRPLYSSAGKVIGLMVLMSRKPICDAERAETMMEIFAGRASAEFERRQHELAMKKTDLLFRQVTDNIAPTVYVATPGLTEFLYVSPRFATFWGHPPARLLLEPDLWFVGVHPDDRALLSQAHAGWSSWADDAQVCEFRVVHAQTGHERWLRDRCWKIWNTADSLEPRVVGIVEDVSIERRALEHLDKARQMAEEASTAKTLFLANVSHEIRTPLQGVLGMLELLESAPMAPDQRDNLLIAKRSAEHMLFLVNDLLDVVRIERGKLEICPERFSLREDMEHLWSRFAHSSESHGVDFDVNLSPDLPDIVVGDKHRLAQVLDNILNNAFKFTSRGGRVTFTASLPTTDVYRRLGRSPDDMEQQQQQQRWVLFSVADTGIGITADKLPHIFDAFYQVDAVHTKKYAGLGMGLKICSELITMMHGQLWVDSTPGKGTTFYILLPFYQPTREPEEERETERAEADGPVEVAHKPLDILLVEDNIVNQKVICRQLAPLGYNIQIANNGVEAIEKVCGTPFDVILMDVQMPVMDGLTATLKIRELDMNQVPIIGLTAGATQEDKEKCMSAGMDDYLSKPVSRAGLLQALRRWTVRRSGANNTDATMGANPETTDRSNLHSHN